MAVIWKILQNFPMEQTCAKSLSLRGRGFKIWRLETFLSNKFMANWQLRRTPTPSLVKLTSKVIAGKLVLFALPWAHLLERETIPYSCHGVFTDRTIF